MRFTIAAALIALGGSVFSASLGWAAAQFPNTYQGVWNTAGGGTSGAGGALECKASDFNEHTNDGLVSIAKGSVRYWESGYDLSSITETNLGTINLAMSCGGEGESYKTRETWVVQRFEGKDVLVMTILSR